MPGYTVLRLIFGLRAVYSLGTMTCKAVQIMALQEGGQDSVKIAGKCGKLAFKIMKLKHLFVFKRI